MDIYALVICLNNNKNWVGLLNIERTQKLVYSGNEPVAAVTPTIFFCTVKNCFVDILTERLETHEGQLPFTG